MLIQTLRLSQYRPLKPDIERLNKHKITKNLKKKNFEIKQKLKTLPDDLQFLILQCINKKVHVLRTKDIRLKQFLNLLKEFNIQLEI